MAQKTEVVTLRLSSREARRVSAVQALTHLDKATLLRDFIEDGMRRRVLEFYGEGEITAQRAADVLDISLREFMSLLEKNGLAVNWDSDLLRDYMTKRYGSFLGLTEDGFAGSILTSELLERLRFVR
jgi:hypothetical protein